MKICAEASDIFQDFFIDTNVQISITEEVSLMPRKIWEIFENHPALTYEVKQHPIKELASSQYFHVQYNFIVSLTVLV